MSYDDPQTPSIWSSIPRGRLVGAFIRWMGVGVRTRGGRVVLLFLLLGWVCTFRFMWWAGFLFPFSKSRV